MPHDHKECLVVDDFAAASSCSADPTDTSLPAEGLLIVENTAAKPIDTSEPKEEPSPAQPFRPQAIMPSPRDKLRTDNKFTHTQKGSFTSKVRTYFMLGTDTSYKDQMGYADGEIFSAIYNMLKEAIIVDGPKQEGAFCANANEVPSHTVGLILTDLSKSPIEILNLSGHSRGAIGTLIIAHELDRIKNALTPSMSPQAIREAVLNSTDADTKKILQAETADFNDLQWQALAQNIKDLQLNLFLLDPVPGNYRLSSGYRWQDPRICKTDHFEVPNIVANIHVQYAGDERTHQFDSIRVKHINPEFKHLTLDLLPGHHGTASGNITDRGTADKSSFVHFYAKLKDLLLTKTPSPTAAAALKPDVAAAQSPAIKTQIHQCITELADIEWRTHEEQKENFKKVVCELTKQHFDATFDDLIKEITTKTELTAKEFTSAIYLSIRRAFNSAQKITSINILEYFIKYGSLSENDFEEDPTDEVLFHNQYQTFNKFLPLIFTQKDAGSEMLTELEIEKLKIYDQLSSLKKTFMGFRDSYYDGLTPLSSNHLVLGRQVRCGLTWGSLQDYVSIFHDDSPYVNSAHADLLYKHAFNEVAKCQDSQDGALTPNIHKITLLLQKIILVSNSAKERKAVPSTSRSILSFLPLPLFSPSTPTLGVKIGNSSKLNVFKELLSSCLTEILFTNDKDSIAQLFEIVNGIALFNDVKHVFFTEKHLEKYKVERNENIAALIDKITKDSEGKIIEPEVAFKEALKASIEEATKKALNNLEEQVKVDTAVILGVWEQLKEKQDLTNEEKDAHYTIIEQNIHKVLKTLIFIKDNNLNCQGFLGELQQPQNKLLDVLNEILIKKQEIISKLTEKEKETIELLKAKDSEILKHARSFGKKEKELEETRKELSKKEADLKVIKVEYKELTEKYDVTTDQLQAMQVDLKTTAAKLEDTEKELNEIIGQLESANDQLKQAQDTNESLLNERDQLNSELAAILAENETFKAENTVLKDQIAALQTTIDVFQTSEDQGEKVEQLETIITGLQAENNLQHETHQSLRAELAAVLAREEALKVESANLKSQITALQTPIDVQSPMPSLAADQSEQIRQLQSQIAEKQSQIDGWQDENARKNIKALEKLINQYESHLYNHVSDQGVRKREVLDKLRSIVNDNISPRDQVEKCRSLLGETKATLILHRDPKFIRFIHDCLRILTGVAFYQKMSGQSPTFFNRPSHGARFVQQSEQALTASA